MLSTLAVSGYRSLRDLAIPLGALNLALEKTFGETMVADDLRASWHWPKR
jgi:predicted ATPase